MKRTNRQLFIRFAGITLLGCIGFLPLPELRAEVPREPLSEFVAEHLPADTHSLIFFRAQDLDAEGSKLLRTASTYLSEISVRLDQLLSLMQTAEQNRGIFYLAQTATPGTRTILLKNSNGSAEMVFAPIHTSRSVTIRPLEGGYFLLWPAEKNGLPEELRRKFAAEPGDILWMDGIGKPFAMRIFKRDKEYIFSAILPESCQTYLASEALIQRLSSQIPQEEKATLGQFIARTLHTSIVEEKGEKCIALECPISEKTLELASVLLLRIREEKQAENVPNVVSVEPANGATNVDPNLQEIKVTFDRRMDPTSWAFCQRSNNDFPETPSRPSYNSERTVITLPVRLQPERTYNIYLNSPPYLGFTSETGGVLKMYHYTFTTGKAKIQ